MRSLTKREFEVITLYSRGLTFKEIGYALNIAMRTAINYYMRVKAKDKGRISRAKRSRAFNKSEFNQMLSQTIKELRAYNKMMMEYTFTQHRVKPLQAEIKKRCYDHIKESLIFTFKSFCRWRVNLTKKVNVNSKH